MKSDADGHPRPRLDSAAAIAANLLIVSVLIYASVLEGVDADFYYRTVQEDAYLEWATFWAFLTATGVFVFAAHRQRKTSGGIPWFLVGVGLFCFVFAMEEISWFQRQLGYLPPDYFLERNFQQEFNFHNVLGKSFRKLSVTAAVLAYGLVLPLAASIPVLQRWMHQIGVVAPPWQLAPLFLVPVFLYQIYPWRFSGEWAELILGFAFLFVGLVQRGEFAPTEAGTRSTVQQTPLSLTAAALLVVGLGIASETASRGQLSYQRENLSAAEKELEALRRDFAGGRAQSSCNVHKRLYSFKQKYSQDGLLEGEFAALTQTGLPPSRGKFLLDPWNHPYWIRDFCEDGYRVTFLYSFGPNRRRDSDNREIRGDDVGVYVRG